MNRLLRHDIKLNLMRFGLFLLVNAILIIRPTDVIPGLEDLPIYNYVILAALLVTAGPVLAQLSLSTLAERPITACVVGFLAAIVVSHLANGELHSARVSGQMFGKIVLYYLLVVANLTSTRHVRIFLVAICGFMMIQVSLGLLQYFEFLDIESLKPHVVGEILSESGEMTPADPRLCGAGIFHDPNDLCVLMVIGTVIAAYLLADRELGVTRFAAAVPLAIFLGAIPLTYSRGGMLSLLAAMGCFLFIRLGWRRGAVLLALAVPVVAMALGGRMTNFDLDNPDDTSQHRIRAWSDGLIALRSAPMFGIGQGKYETLGGLVAHNSYVEAYVETGILGGTMFVGAFAYAIWGLRRSKSEKPRIVNDNLGRLGQYLLTTVMALMIGMVSLSRGYTPPTYLVLALVTSYLNLTTQRSHDGAPPLTLSLAVRWFAISVLIVLCLSVATGQFVRWQ